jgi:hypothetical protein
MFGAQHSRHQVLKGWVGEEKGFDPLGVTDALPVYWVREAELKHGRICMLATVGEGASMGEPRGQ